VLNKVLPVVERLVAEAAEATGGAAAPRSVEVNVALGDGRILLGTVQGVIDKGADGVLVRAVNYSKLGPKHRLTAWVRFLALTAAHPDRVVEGITIGKYREGGRRHTVSIATLAALPGDPATRRAAAIAQLELLVDLLDRGLCEPLPLYCKTSAAWAEAPPAKRAAACAKLWDPSSSDFGVSEAKEPEHQLVLGGVVPFLDLQGAAPAPDESGDGWAPGETTRFGRYALRLWSGLRAVEAVSDR
jgi:exodeoxyribonuclease V gamma subunit